MLREIKRIWQDSDKLLLLAVVASSIFGILAILTSTRSYESLRFVIVQSGAFIVGLVCMFAMMIPNYTTFPAVAKYLYGIGVAFLLLVLLFGVGSEDAGSQSWIRFGSIGIQPSEIVKIIFIITFSAHLSSVEDYVNSPFPLIGLLLHGGFLIGLILLQPDYGTAMVYIFIFICMLFCANISYKYIVGSVCAFVPVSLFMWFFVLKPYQKNRFFDFLNPERDMLGSGYQTMQSRVAIGSGGLAGKGLFKGTLVQSGSLPAGHTDFIFSSIGEEFGFIGCAIVIVLLFLIIYKCLYIAKTARTSLGSYMCIGVAAMFIFHTYENIGMCLGLMPVTGIPLPFFSYGGSSILACMLAMGIVLNVGSRANTATI